MKLALSRIRKKVKAGARTVAAGVAKTGHVLWKNRHEIVDIAVKVGGAIALFRKGSGRRRKR